MKITLSRRIPTATLVLVACTLVLAGAVAACAAPDEGAGPLTREEYLLQGNAVCAAGNARIAAAMPVGLSGPPTGPEAQAVYDTVVTEVTTMIGGLKGLTPPTELQADVTNMLTEADAALVTIKADGQEAFFASEEDAFAKANEIANKIGLTVCAESS